MCRSTRLKIDTVKAASVDCAPERRIAQVSHLRPQASMASTPSLTDIDTDRGSTSTSTSSPGTDASQSDTTATRSDCTCFACTGEGHALKLHTDQIRFIWYAEGLPSSCVVSVSNLTCRKLAVRVRRAANRAKVAARPSKMQVQPGQAAELLFVQGGLSRDNASTAAFRVEAAPMRIGAQVQAYRITTAVVDPPPETVSGTVD